MWLNTAVWSLQGALKVNELGLWLKFHWGFAINCMTHSGPESSGKTPIDTNELWIGPFVFGLYICEVKMTTNYRIIIFSCCCWVQWGWIQQTSAGYLNDASFYSLVFKATLIFRLIFPRQLYGPITVHLKSSQPLMLLSSQHPSDTVLFYYLCFTDREGR